MGEESRTFKANYTADGIGKLQNQVTEKLKEFMGDYTDDTLVEYVIVLLKNGRTKAEARNELNVFLGDDDSNAFVTWLWYHLSANLNSYVQSEDSYVIEEAKQKPIPREQEISQGMQHSVSDHEKGSVDRIPCKVDGVLDKQPVKALVKKNSLPRSEVAQSRFEEKTRHRPDSSRKSLSPRPSNHGKRNRLDDRHRSERHTGSLSAINPTSRLLQFAVREAVGGVANKTNESNPKRLRSVVAASTIDDSRRKLRSMATVSASVEIALKAAAEAAEDVVRVRPTGNVFDRLGRSVDALENYERASEYTDDIVDDIVDEEYEFHDRVAIQPRLNQHQMVNNNRRHVGSTMFASDAELFEAEISPVIEINEIDDVTTMGYGGRNLTQTATSFHMDSVPETTHYGNPSESNKLKRKYQFQPAAVVNPSHDRTPNISANANIWKPPPKISTQEIKEANASTFVPGDDTGGGKFGAQHLKEINHGLVGNGNGTPALYHKTELQKTTSGVAGSLSNVPSPEDADARSIFVSNVHFAATKDSLLRHFNKFGQVLRVTILTDAATGQPKGSAYVEFMQKVAAEQALSLDGTSFMSRIIKVGMKGTAQPEATTQASTTWPRAVNRGSPYPITRFSRTPFPRGSPSSFRVRGLVRAGARSLQWKRETQATPAASDPAGMLPANNASPAARSLTYVRPELKAEGTST